MYSTHRQIMKYTIYEYGECDDNKKRIDWIRKGLGMTCLAAIGVWFTAEMEETFQQISLGKKYAMKEFLELQNSRINYSVAEGLYISCFYTLEGAYYDF